jgi:FkbM family methyltransferase
MNSKRFYDCLVAQILRFVPNPFGRYRRRYEFFQRVKDSNLTLHGRIRHSGIRVPLNLGDYVQYWMFMDGAYEHRLVDFLCPRVKGKVLFDVGANVGSYTLSLAKSARQIYSFEASPSNCRILGGFVGRAGLSNVEIVNKAISDSCGEEIALFTSPYASGAHSQFHDFGTGHEKVTTITLDQFAQDRKIGRVDVIKMDIEGSELRAFQGARQILRESRPLLLVEFNAPVATQAGWKLSELYELIRPYGYRACELHRRKLAPFDESRLSDPNCFANLIFQHEP